MKFEVAYCTDIGCRKEVNQDSLYIKQIKIHDKNIVMAVICDGMGGLSQGEVASATVVRDFHKWFMERFITAYQEMKVEGIKSEWLRLLYDANEKILKYGKNKGIQLGTTATAMLLFDDGQYVVAHVGDTRLYLINHEKICQITEDQTYIAKEIKLGHMTKEDAENDFRRNILLQCVGAVERLEPEIYEGVIGSNCYMLLCSDGFRHKYREEEMQEALSRDMTQMDRDSMYAILRTATDLCIQRGENDNISSVLIKVS